MSNACVYTMLLNGATHLD